MEASPVEDLAVVVGMRSELAYVLRGIGFHCAVWNSAVLQTTRC